MGALGTPVSLTANPLTVHLGSRLKGSLGEEAGEAGLGLDGHLRVGRPGGACLLLPFMPGCVGRRLQPPSWRGRNQADLWGSCRSPSRRGSRCPRPGEAVRTLGGGGAAEWAAAECGGHSPVIGQPVPR